MGDKNQDKDFEYSTFESDVIKGLLNRESQGGRKGILSRGTIQKQHFHYRSSLHK